MHDTLYSNTVLQAFYISYIISVCHIDIYLILFYKSFENLYQSLFIVFGQIESPVVSGGDAGWGEWRSPGGHAVGNPDVPVREEGKPPVPGKAATGQVKAQENHKERLRSGAVRAEETENMRAKRESQDKSDWTRHKD